MRLNDDSTWTFSPTDLATYTRCGHAIQLRRLSREGLLVAFAPPGKSIRADMLSKRGEEHEAAHLETFKNRGKNVVEIPPRDVNAATLTQQAMRAGADVVTQAALTADGWFGYADFLQRIEVPSELGPWSYEVTDAKLSMAVHPYFILQLGIYGDLLAQIQGLPPKRMHLVLGDGVRRSFLADDYSAYLRRIRLRFEEAFGAGGPSLPYPVEFCALCEWNKHCYRHLVHLDHLSLVAGIRRDHVKLLEGHGVSTLTALGEQRPDLPEREIAGAILDRLHHQARLQLEQRHTGKHRYEFLAVEERRGLQLLPEPSPGDIFFDVEADPFEDLTYLLGVRHEEGGESKQDAIWSYNISDERVAFERLVDFFIARREAFPGAHAYHYGPADVSTLKKLMGRHGTREHAIDNLLRGDAFVDLLAVVRQSIRISHPSYSLKKVETFFFDRQSEGVIDAGGAIAAYEEWLESQEETKREEIVEYNREDCLSIVALRSWLVQLRGELERERGITLTWREPKTPEPTNAEKEAERVATDELSRALLERVPPDRNTWTDEERANFVLAHLLHYHRREAKPGWWAHFARQEMSLDELIDDNESIGMLTPTGRSRQVTKQSTAYEFSFERQQHKFKAGDTAFDPYRLNEKGFPERAGTVESIDDELGLIELKRTESFSVNEPPPVAIVPVDSMDESKLQAALRTFAASVLADPSHGSPFRVGIDLLRRALPRVTGHPSGTALHDVHVQEEEIQARAAALDHSYLFVQGPPGAGKTYHGARIIVDLLRRGRRVGVTASTHKAIENMLHEVEKVAALGNFHFSGFKQSTNGTQAFISRLASPRIVDSTATFPRGKKPKPTDASINLVAGTPFLFTTPDHQQAFDDLVIDEAGQMSLANAIGCSLATRNVVLLGDPLQLAQVSQGTHPEGCDASVLGHLLGEDLTVPPERGIFLEQSRRMHADVCRFISDVVYDARLEAHESCNRRRVGSSSLSGTGLRYHAIVHDGNTQRSREEAEWIAQTITAMLRDGTYTDTSGTRKLMPSDFMIVTPYNLQVTELRTTLKGLQLDVPVGTVDKFQGQEAPVVFFSMGTSSGDDIPRSLDFLFSRNRLNVAISRAQCLAILVASPRLLDVDCRTVEQMKLVNALCRFVEMATVVA